jgi:outer membrane immunogenic protein
MKNFLIASIATLALASTAQAADMSMPMKAPLKAPPPSYSWTGCYVDGGGGYGLWDLSHYGETYPGRVPYTVSGDSAGRGYYGELGAGCDYQFPIPGFGNFVVGALGGYDFMSLKGQYVPENTGGLTGNLKETSSWFAGGRIGYLVTPNFLTYVSGGYTQAHFGSEAYVNGGGPVGFSLSSHNYNGYFLGGGAETSLTPWLPVGFFLRSDYRFSTYQGADVPNAAGSIVLGAGEHNSGYVQQIGTELIYRFNYH